MRQEHHESLSLGPWRTLRGERMLRRWTLHGHPVTFSATEVLMAAWKACWLPGYFLRERNFSVSVTILSDYTEGIVPVGAMALVIGLTGIVHVTIMALAWFGVVRPPRVLRLMFNMFAAVLFGFIFGVATALELYTAAGPYLILTLLALGNLQRAARNGRGYRGLP